MPETHDLRALSRQWFERVWNRKDLSAVDQLCHAHAVGHGLSDTPHPPMFVPDFLAFHDRFTRALPDLHVQVEDVLVDGDKTATRYSFTATHLGEGLGLPPSKKPIRVTGMTITRWQDGKIAESWDEFDKAALASQISS